MRFFAACLVVVNHAGLHLPIMDRVTFFLVLSGFLFCWIYARQWEKAQRFEFKSFYLKRAIRILPAFYFSILVTIVGKTLLHKPVDPWAVVASVGNFVNYYNASNDHWNTGFEHYWTLSLEEQFYFIWPLFFVFFMRRGRTSFSRFLLATVVVSCVWRYVLIYVLHATPAYLYNALDTRLDSLAIGCLLGLWVTDRRVEHTLQFVARRGYEPILTFAAVAVLNLLGDQVRNTWGFTVQALLVALFVMQVMLLHRHWLWSWLNHRWVVYLGTLSYSIYLLHGWGIAFGKKAKFLPEPLQYLACVAASVAIAALSYHFIEKPALAFRSRLFRTGDKGPADKARVGNLAPASALARAP